MSSLLFCGDVVNAKNESRPVVHNPPSSVQPTKRGHNVDRKVAFEVRKSLSEFADVGGQSALDQCAHAFDRFRTLPSARNRFQDCSVQSLRRLKAQTGLRIEVGSINAQYAPEFRHLLISRLMPAVIYNVPEFRHQINDRTLGRACTSQPGATENQDSENGQDGGDSSSVTVADNFKIVGQP